MPALQNMPTINQNLNQHHGASPYTNIPWLHRYHPAANTPPPPPYIEQGQPFSFVIGGLLATSNHFFLSFRSVPNHCKKWCTITIHHCLGVLHQCISPSLSVPIASDISTGPLRGWASWLLVPSTRRTTSTHHPLQVSTNGSRQRSEDRSSLLIHNKLEVG